MIEIGSEEQGKTGAPGHAGLPLFEGAGSKELVRRLSKRSATGGSWAPATLARVSLRLGRRTERGVQRDNVRERLGGRALMGQVRKVCSSRACKTVTPKSGGQTERVDRRGSDRLVKGQSSCSPLSGERRSPTNVQAPHTQKHTHIRKHTHTHTHRWVRCQGQVLPYVPEAAVLVVAVAVAHRRVVLLSAAASASIAVGAVLRCAVPGRGLWGFGKV